MRSEHMLRLRVRTSMCSSLVAAQPDCHWVGGSRRQVAVAAFSFSKVETTTATIGRGRSGRTPRMICGTWSGTSGVSNALRMECYNAIMASLARRNR